MDDPTPRQQHRRRGGSFKAIAVVGLCAIAILVASCGDDGDGGESGSDAENITLYTGRNMELVGDLLDDFTEETGIDVEVREGDTAELAAQLLTEGDSTPADVFFSQDAGALGALSKAEMLAELPQETLDMVPPGFRSVNGDWIGTSGRARVIIVNPELVPDPPTSIDDVLDPKYKGQIGFAPSNASFQAFVTGLRVLRGEDGAKQWLEAFAAQEPHAYENNVAVRDAVDAGDISLGLVNHYYLYELIEEKGEENVTAENVFLKGGDPGGLINVAGIGILEASDKYDMALELVNYLVGPEGQDYFANTTFEYPLSDGTEANVILPPLDTLEPPNIDLSDLDTLEETQELLSATGLLTQ
jgi:iron(III) transport system substrate-binding protein